MPTLSERKEPPMLTKWRSMPEREGISGSGTLSVVRRIEHQGEGRLDAVPRTKTIQNIGGVRAGQLPSLLNPSSMKYSICV
jgi:hypothetical protein